MRLIILRRTSIAGGNTMRVAIERSGSWYTITATSPIKESRSRPIEVMSKLSTWVAAAAPGMSRAANSEEWRSAKKPMLSLRSLPNNRRWFSAMMWLAIRDRITDCPKVAAPLSEKIAAAANPSVTSPGKLCCR
jgi:hypothetical protein